MSEKHQEVELTESDKQRLGMNLLNKAYNKYDNENVSWKYGLFHVTVVLIFFFLFQPFGIRDKDLTLKLLLFPGYSLIAFFYNMSKFYAIRRIIKSKKTWTLKNETLSLIISIFPLVTRHACQGGSVPFVYCVSQTVLSVISWLT